MARDGFVAIVNLASFQHYKDRNPPWIKLHTALLEKYEYQCLQDASKSHLVGLWMLASRLDNKIPNDPVWIAQRIGATSPVNLQPLLDAGFIELLGSRASKPLALGLQDAGPETEAEGEAEGETETEQDKASAAEGAAPLADAIPEDEPLNAWYGRVLKPLLYRPPLPDPSALRTMQGRDVTVLQRQLRHCRREDIAAAVAEMRTQAEEGGLPGWVGPGQTFTLRAMVTDANGGIATFDRFRHAAHKRRDNGGSHDDR
jgi:hypothetical protein